MHKKNFFSQLTTHIWHLFLSGLIAILPLTLTIGLFNFCIKLVKNWLAPLHKVLPNILLVIPHSEIIVGILFIFAVGIILRLFIIKPLTHGFERLIFKIPLVKPVYSGIKQLVHGFNPQDTSSFKDVAIIEFPRKGVYSIGFITNEVLPTLSPDPTKQYFCVFIPTTPNPTTGFFIYAPSDEIREVSLTRQEAMALIISGGIVQPDIQGKK